MHTDPIGWYPQHKKHVQACILNDVELAAMAKAWAHPADISLLGQTLPTTSGDFDSEGDFLPGMGQRPQVRSDHPPLDSEPSIRTPR